MKAPSESGLLKDCLALLAAKRVPCWRSNTGGAHYGEGKRRRFVRFGVPGCPDILGLLPPGGRFLGVETKMPGRKRTEAQIAFARNVEAAGGVVLCVNSVAQLEEALTELGHG